MTISAALLLGLLLGIRHALDADHIVAVTSIISRSGSIPRAIFSGLVWGIGHSLTILAVGFIVLTLKLTIPTTLALSMEFFIGILLVILGAPLIWRIIKSPPHFHIHQHRQTRHVHVHSHTDSNAHSHSHLRRSLLVGILHGLAGSGALTILVLNTMSSLVEGMGFLLVFGIGSIFSMLVFSGLISLPLHLTRKFSLKLNFLIQGASGLVSVVLGFFIMWQVLFESGHFL